jgi:hypothetical protein
VQLLKPSTSFLDDQIYFEDPLDICIQKRQSNAFQHIVTCHIDSKVVLLEQFEAIYDQRLPSFQTQETAK